MQYELILTGKFKKSLKPAKKRGLDLKLLDKVITMLQNDIPLCRLDIERFFYNPLYKDVLIEDIHRLTIHVHVVRERSIKSVAE